VGICSSNSLAHIRNPIKGIESIDAFMDILVLICFLNPIKGIESPDIS